MQSNRKGTISGEEGMAYGFYLKLVLNESRVTDNSQQPQEI